MITDKLLSRNFILAKNKRKNRGGWIKKYLNLHVYMKYCIKELFMTFFRT